MSSRCFESKEYPRESLLNLLAARSKHSTYQELYPTLEALLGLDAPPSGKSESARWAYMQSRMEWANLSVIDIGANTGYFSIAAMQSGATQVIAIEGNTEHAKFLVAASQLMGGGVKIEGGESLL